MLKTATTTLILSILASACGGYTDNDDEMSPSLYNPYDVDGTSDDPSPNLWEKAEETERAPAPAPEPLYCPALQGTYQKVQSSSDCYGWEHKSIFVTSVENPDGDAGGTGQSDTSAETDTCSDPITSKWSDDGCEYTATRRCYYDGGSYLSAVKSSYSYDGSLLISRNRIGFDNGVVCNVKLTITRID